MSVRKTLAIFVLLLLGYAPVSAQEPEAADLDRFEIRREIYDYKSGERRDPFLSIVTAAKLEQEKEKKKTQDPLGSFDVRQMKLVAVVKDQAAGDFYALLGMPDGKFYTVKEGTAMGLHEGLVVGIALDRVVVREKKRNYKGELIPQDTIIRLREGEEE
jgi:Tfp pilus assembly protein PilP